MSQFGFGAGILTGLRNDVSGIQTPRIFGTLQDVMLEFTGDIRELWGASQFPEDTARGKTKITGKAKFARIQGRMYNDIFFGQTLVGGTSLKFTTPPGESFTPGTGSVNYTVSNSTKVPLTDQGVNYDDTQGLQLDSASGTPASAQYNFNAATGVYIFASADIGRPVRVNYLYTDTTGYSLAIQNPFMGTTPRFAATFKQIYEGLQVVLVLNNCVASRLTYPTRIDEHVIQDLDFSAFAGGSGIVGNLSVSQ